MDWPGKSSVEFCKAALREANVASVPGSAFGQEGYVRFSFGAEPKVLRFGIRALAKWLKEKKKL